MIRTLLIVVMLAPQQSTPNDGIPSIPGLINCGTSVQCFLDALNKPAPVAVTRTEIVEQGTAVITSKSVWWVTCAGDRCAVSFRVDDFEAKINEKFLATIPPETRSTAEERLNQMKRDFGNIRGKTGTCAIALKDVRPLVTGPALSLMTLGPVSNFGKTCSGPAFANPTSPLGRP